MKTSEARNLAQDKVRMVADLWYVDGFDVGLPTRGQAIDVAASMIRAGAIK